MLVPSRWLEGRSLQENSGSKAAAAAALGMSRATIYRKIKAFGIA